ncbi:alpha-N-acetylneuraminate alpha-2,8-sialyltransferase ST8SIA3 [Melanerpes formicivorus]|uniref:alpha-N-acetylneuraminate alpha-2,8-sialyltransferase ST8SIA3 n=1 Tax=Melanerpes formicivorus TaxID=211600 RepID=UPI00358E2D6E
MRSCRMVRVASVLGLVMLSIALLILSLISYVSLKKDNIFGAPRAAGPGGPRMYMFHAGFRSQLALKFLDPSFVPITNSLSQELQEKPSRWTFNRTAFAQQRQELLAQVDVVKNFSLTRGSVRVGQLLHYDYSSHKYVFSVSSSFRSLLPEVSPLQQRHHNVCAVEDFAVPLAPTAEADTTPCGTPLPNAILRCQFETAKVKPIS